MKKFSGEHKDGNEHPVSPPRTEDLLHNGDDPKQIHLLGK